MIRIGDTSLARRRMAGLSLIELMIAMVMALIVAAGIISVFASTSTSNKVQAQMAVLQEEGRFAIQSLRSDLGNANGSYCNNTGGNAGITGSGLSLDALRAPTVYASAALVLPDYTATTPPLPAPTEAYSLPSSMFMRGYDCGVTAGSCLPVDPSGGTGIPAMGKLPGNRVFGASVLTFRYLRPGSGWAIVPTGSAPGTTITPTSPTSGIVYTINLAQLAGEDPISDFTGTNALLADCSNSQIFAVTVSGGVIAPTSANYAQPLDISKGSAPRVFDFTNDFQTVTYYLKVVPTSNGHTTGELERRVNGLDTPLVRGVERLDFRYGIIDAGGATEFLTANQVDTATDAAGNSIPCPPGVSTDGGMGNAGCLWRAVQTIEVHILMDGQTPLYTLRPAELNYIYSPDCDPSPSPCAATPVIAPTAHAVNPKTGQGFPLHLIRREFTSVVPLRNFNP